MTVFDDAVDRGTTAAAALGDYRQIDLQNLIEAGIRAALPVFAQALRDAERGIGEVPSARRSSTARGSLAVARQGWIYAADFVEGLGQVSAAPSRSLVDDLLVDRQRERIYETPWGRSRALNWVEMKAVRDGTRPMTWAEFCATLIDSAPEIDAATTIKAVAKMKAEQEAS